MMDEARYNGLVAGLWKRILAAADRIDPDVLDAVGTADFLRTGPCLFALIYPRSERSFVQRAESAGLRYSLVRRVDDELGRHVVRPCGLLQRQQRHGVCQLDRGERGPERPFIALC